MSADFFFQSNIWITHFGKVLRIYSERKNNKPGFSDYHISELHVNASDLIITLHVYSQLSNLSGHVNGSVVRFMQI